MSMILYGAPVREEIKKNLISRVERLKKKPTLAIIQVGDRADSNIYIKNKIKFGKEIGVKVKVENFSLNADKKGNAKELERKVVEKIEELNKDENVNGIIVQLPLPDDMDTEEILNKIDERKDTDGLREVEEGRKNKVSVTPATARAVMHLLDFYNIPVSGKKVAVIGRSKLAGGPVAAALRQRRAEVSVCHRKTGDVARVCREAQILVAAAGQPNLVTADFVNKNQVVIDVGINKTSPPGPLPFGEGESGSKSRLVGDVVFEEVKPLVAAISPVPGGVGPLTVASLFENLLDLCYA